MNSSNKIKEGKERRRIFLRSQMAEVPSGPLQSEKLSPVEVSVLTGLPLGLLPVTALQSDLSVGIPYWGYEIPRGYAYITLKLLSSTDAIVYESRKRFDGPIAQADFPLPHPIAKGDIPHEGDFRIVYDYVDGNGNTNDSLPFPIVIDRTPPYYNPNPSLAFPTELTVPSPTITDATFSGGVTTFVCTLPDYTGRTDEDKIIVFWGPGLPEGIDAPDPAFGPIAVPADLQIPIPKTIIESRPNGPTFAVYWLTDKAGNPSSVSKPAEVDVQLGALPANLQDPQVPLGPLVDLADAHLGVNVLVPGFQNPLGATIQAKWGATPLGPIDPGSTPRDVLVPVPWSILSAEYAGGPGEQPVQVSYQVKRGTLLFPDAPLTVDVDVDFSTIGPPNPDEPDPVNKNLEEIHLEGVDGLPDELTPNDFGQSVVATTELYDPALPGEVLELYWGTQQTPVASFTVASEAAGDPISFTIPWTAIEPQANNDALLMYYTINSATGNNPQNSKSTPVKVNVLTVHFPPVSFPDVYTDDAGNQTLSCASLFSEDYTDPAAKFGFRVQVPGDPDLQAGDVIVAEWMGYEVDGTTSIPATRFTHTHPALTDDEVTNGFIFLVEPYAAHILPIRQGFAEVTYTVSRGGVPTPADPMLEKQYVSIIRPGPGLPTTCEVPPPRP